MEKTIEEVIIDVYNRTNNQLFSVPRQLAIIAMKEFADQEKRKEAIAFFDYVDSYYAKYRGGWVLKYNLNTILTIEEVYDLYQQSLKTPTSMTNNPEQLTVAEAIEQGYNHFAVGLEVDDLIIRPLEPETVIDYDPATIVLLCEKEPKILTVTPKDIYEPLADCIANDNEVQDDDDRYGDIIRKSVNWVQIAELINQGLANRPVYYPTDIKLIP